MGMLKEVTKAAVKHFLGQELLRRLGENENRNGRKVRDFLVHKRDGSKNESLVNLVLWHTPDIPDDDAEDEKKSIAHLKISEELRDYLSMYAVGLGALIEGKFNRTTWKIRDHVRTSIKKELRYQNRMISNAAPMTKPG